MRKYNTSFVLAAAAGLAVGSLALARDAQSNAPQGPAQSAEAAAARDDQGANRARQGDPQAEIDATLAKIAEDPKTAGDKLFVLTAALQTQSQIALAKAAAEKSQSPQVKQLAQQMLTLLTEADK